MSDALITADRLARMVDAGEPVTILDVRWTLGGPDGRPLHEAGHIPGAVYVDLHHELADPSQPPTEGRHPLPPVDRLQASARAWGVSAGRPVVVYDDSSGMAAARAWWLLRYAGVHDVRVLDGALSAWTRAGHGLDQGPVTARPGDVELRYGALPVLTPDAAAAFPRIGTLLDARAAERYRGDSEPIDPRAGHIPGAVSAPTTGNLDADGGFLEPGSVRARFESLGVDLGAPVAVYCGSGVTAAHTLLALSAAGVDGVLYPGSWSQWSNLPDRPVATGDHP
ncbi:sulfurtransferase [Microbacterium marinilacus]|uniref:Sulfurtransferase n=1 Tax=Microbacterium marinilacus TaxID=415209 RepID=A0ABP7BD05_9MICO|nr:sulfurtransferase [Microbacterium marinilacus]MBY0689297.1 sulfurtransferase [Microbacterium marinilacus]